jgi:chemotaxis protein methyltransferase CheR
MAPETFDRFRRLVYEKSGIALGPGKEALVSARVGKRVRALRLPNPHAYLRYVMADETGEELIHLIDAISTNVTSFFREPAHFEFLEHAVAEWLAHGPRPLRFWSAASSTGEESYSLAMSVLEAVGRPDADVRILATDISTRVLEKCRAGSYSQERVQSVPPALRERYLERCREHGENRYVVKPAIRKMITFVRLNLAEAPFPMRGPFDAVFCRNVMIYFDNQVRTRLLAEIHRLLKPGGYLFVGHAESLAGMMSLLNTVKPSIYMKA